MKPDFFESGDDRMDTRLGVVSSTLEVLHYQIFLLAAEIWAHSCDDSCTFWCSNGTLRYCKKQLVQRYDKSIILAFRMFFLEIDAATEAACSAVVTLTLTELLKSVQN